VTTHKNGTLTYSHSVVTPVIVAPGNARVIPLEAEFITPQDGHEQPDGENAAAKRWLGQFGARYRPLGITILGDDLYCKQPVCEAIRQQGLNYAGNNVANSRVKWGLRIARACLRAGGAGRAQTSIALVVDVALGGDGESRR
jgi:hypothetical protein